jgi:hypothetical protein
VLCILAPGLERFGYFRFVERLFWLAPKYHHNGSIANPQSTQIVARDETHKAISSRA